MRHLAVLFMVLVAAVGVRADAPPAPQRAIALTIVWDQSGPSVEGVKKVEENIPLSRGLPQLSGRFYELQDANGDVHYAGALIEPRGHKDGPAGGTFRLLVPDLEDARKLMIYERKGGKRNLVKEHQL